MRNILIVIIALVFVEAGLSQIIGLQVEPTQHILAGSALEGAGARMMWLSDKEAFRAGLAQGVQWDMDSVGVRSAAFGGNNIAKGDNSMSWGFDNTSRGALSTSWGSGQMTIGNNSTAWGSGSTTSGFASTAWGSNQSTSGNWSTAWGFGNVSDGQLNTVWGADNMSYKDNNNSTTWGFGNKSGLDSTFTELTTAFGANNEVSGKLATVWGEFNKAQSLMETVVGRWADTLASPNRLGWTASDQLFVIGNGSADDARNNAFAVLKNGNTSVDGDLNIGADLHVDGTTLLDGASSVNGRLIVERLDLKGDLDDVDQIVRMAPEYHNYMGQIKPTGNIFFKGFDHFNLEMGSDPNSGYINFRESGDLMCGLDAESGGSNNYMLNGLALGSFTHSTSLLEIKSSEYDDAIDENISLISDDNGGFANLKIIGDEIAAVKLVDRGAGATFASDFMIRNDGSGHLTIANADNVSDDFETSTDVAYFSYPTDTYQLTVMGSAFASGGVFMNSDRKLKSDIADINEGLKTIMSLNPKSYYYDHKSEKLKHLNLPTSLQYGLIAQEVEKVIPSIVKSPSDQISGKGEEGQGEIVETYKAINYSALVPILISAIQEQQAQIEELKQQIEHK